MTASGDLDAWASSAFYNEYCGFLDCKAMAGATGLEPAASCVTEVVSQVTG